VIVGIEPDTQVLLRQLLEEFIGFIRHAPEETVPLIDSDPYEREIRWLTLIRSQKELKKKLLTHLKKLFSCIRRILFKKSLKHKVFELGMNLVR
jgi:hypothetical protein